MNRKPECPDVLLRANDVQRVMGICRTTLYNLLDKDPTFPRPVKLTKKAIAWPQNEILEWIEEKKRNHRAFVKEPSAAQLDEEKVSA